MPTRDRIDPVEVCRTEETLRVRLADRSSLVFVRGRVHRVEIGFGRVARVDVSVQPGAVTGVVVEEALGRGVDPNTWLRRIVRDVADWHEPLAWCRADVPLETVVAAFGHPLLVEPFRAGRSFAGEIPRWASPILREPTAAGAARRVADGPTTRRFVRAVASSLLAHDDRVSLDPLAVAVAASGLVTVDDLANLVESASCRAGSAQPPLDHEQLRSLRCGVAEYPATRRVALLRDIATNHDIAAGAATMQRFAWVAHRAPRPLPTRLDALAELCASLIPVIAPPARPDPPPMPVAAIASAAPPVRPRPTRVMPARAEVRTARNAPPAPALTVQRWPIPEPLRVVHGYRHAGLTYAVPTSVDELRWWARRLDNCLAGYAAAVAAGVSWIIGVQRDDALIGCIEVRPGSRTVRQALGPRNRPLPDTVHDNAIAGLAQLGVVQS